ncbi:hypothetical protein Tco_0168937 [Tanacetum coccineum]
MCNESWGKNSFARCLIEINVEDVLPESLTIGVPLIEDTGFTIETVSISHTVATSNVVTPTVATSNVVTPTVVKTNDGFQIVGKRRRRATTSAPKKETTNVDNAKSMLKTTITTTKKGNIATSNLYSALEDESDDDVENVYNESDNLFQSTKTGESSSSFTAAIDAAFKYYETFLQVVLEACKRPPDVVYEVGVCAVFGGGAFRTFVSGRLC